MIPSRLPRVTWGPIKAFRNWANQVTDVLDGRQVASSSDGSIVISENVQGLDLTVAPFANAQGGAGGSAIKVGFGWYYSGGKTGLKIRIRDGTVNDNVTVANNDAEFTLLPNVANYVRLTTYQASNGTVNHSTIDIVSAIPDDPVGDIDIAPATSSRGLWILTTDASSVIDESALRIGGIDVAPLEYGRTCEGALMRMFWSGGGAG